MRTPRAPTYKKKHAADPSPDYTQCGFRLRDGRLHLAGGIVLSVVWSRVLPKPPSSVRVHRDSLGHRYAPFVVATTTEAMLRAVATRQGRPPSLPRTLPTGTRGSGSAAGQALWEGTVPRLSSRRPRSLAAGVTSGRVGGSRLRLGSTLEGRGAVSAMRFRRVGVTSHDGAAVEQRPSTALPAERIGGDSHMALGSATGAYELRFDAGRICLDLLATTHPEERFGSVEVLRAWTVGAGLAPPGTPLAHADASWLVGFRELRGCIGRLVRGGASPHPNEGDGGGHLAADPWPSYDIALARVNELARVAPPAPRAVRGEDGMLVRELDHLPECAALLGAVARDVVDLLTDPVARAGLRECAGDNCPIVYLDMSRGRRRRWCSSEVCGNRERVARHRRRAALART